MTTRIRRRFATRGLLGVAIAFALLLIAAAGIGASSPGATSVVIRNTPQLAAISRILPAPQLTRTVTPTPGDPSLSGAEYVPAGRDRWPGVVLVNGAEVPGGWRSPDVETFAESIADLGIAVYVPDLPGFEQGSLSPAAVEALDGDVNWFRQSGHVAGPAVALAGICVGGSLAILAAARPDLSGHIRSIATIDPYASLRDVLEAATTGRAPNIDGQIDGFEMEPWVRAALVRSLASTIRSPSARRSVLNALAEGTASDPLQGFRRPAPNLDAEGAAWWALLGNTDGSRFDSLYAALPASTKDDLASLSPVSDVGRIQAPILIVAPYHDFAFPAGEATALELANPQHVELSRTSALDHVTPTFSPEVLAGYWRLWRFAGDAVNVLR